MLCSGYVAFNAVSASGDAWVLLIFLPGRSATAFNEAHNLVTRVVCAACCGWSTELPLQCVHLPCVQIYTSVARGPILCAPRTFVLCYVLAVLIMSVCVPKATALEVQGFVFPPMLCIPCFPRYAPCVSMKV